MANIKSAKKRILQSEKRRLRNRTSKISARNMVRKLLKMTSYDEAKVFYPEVVSKLDKLSQKHVIHRNTASNQKSRLALFVNRLKVGAAV